LENVIDPNEESTEKTKKIKIWEFEHSTNEQRHFMASHSTYGQIPAHKTRRFCFKRNDTETTGNLRFVYIIDSEFDSKVVSQSI